MERPKIEIKADSIDKIVSFLGLAGLVTLIALPIYYYAGLPETIVTHFNAMGQPDDYGPKWTLWLLPIIGLMMFILMKILIRHPHSYNYLSPVTPENARQKYTFATKSIRFINSIITLFFAFLTYSTIQTAFGEQTGINLLALGVFLALLFGVIGYFLYKTERNDPSNERIA